MVGIGVLLAACQSEGSYLLWPWENESVFTSGISGRRRENLFLTEEED